MSQFAEEDELFFSMHTVFRTDKDLRRLTDRIREETFLDNEGWYRLDLVLLDMGHPEKAQRVYEILLRQETEESAKAPIYGQLGLVKDQQGEYQEAVRFYGKALAIRQQSLPPNHPDLAIPQYNIGLLYDNMGNYSKACSYYECAKEIICLCESIKRNSLL
jgi:tetratricopeptide (TPR) repeat protein